MDFVDFSAGNFFDMSPAMLGAYGLVGGVGGACLISSVLERKLFGGSFEFIYDAINITLRIGMPAAYFIMLTRFIFSL
ncbi:hypothetical protein [Metabacillus fastidiosus]|uniref:Uncharacterized protein n=1 Tax=Metabacillus fastidiosus TaxID=1458 RepID=A0ABU6NRH0_9BACI|nr:hypothetical protein [Metabacillus fastidiosus]